MSGTIRRDVDLYAEFPDNNTQQILPIDSRDLIASKPSIYPQTVSAAGTNQAGATVIQDSFVIVTGGTGGVKATAGFTEIWNKTNPSVTINVYPISGAQFDTLGTNVPITLAPNAAVRVNMTTSTQGYVV